MHKVKKFIHKIRLSLMFAAVVFFIMLITIFFVFIGMFFLQHLKFIDSTEMERLPLLSFALVSLVVGTFMAMFLSHRPLQPLREIMNAADRIAGGDYTVRVNIKGPGEFKQLNNSFNHMAEEISSVEMLRNDFVNNFSHEFKTPIVSIRGFAKMLKRDDLTKEEKMDYLDIIITESERLAELAMNVLNLSKLEQQSILTDKKSFNVSEQIRMSLVLLDSKWTKKQIDLSFDCDEVYIIGNEELLKQVWINLLDNAFKFTPNEGKVEINIKSDDKKHVFHFMNDSNDVSKEVIAHIFDKFYQGDSSHAVKGNGLGLSIVKKIIELHNGEINVDYTNDSKMLIEIRLPI